MAIKITYCPVNIQKKEDGLIKNYFFKTDVANPQTITAHINLPKYGSDDLAVWLEVARHLGNQEFTSKYDDFIHNASDKCHWRWISYLNVNVTDVQKV